MALYRTTTGLFLDIHLSYFVLEKASITIVGVIVFSWVTIVITLVIVAIVAAAGI